MLTSDLVRKGWLDGDCKPVLVLRKYQEQLLDYYNKNAHRVPAQKKKGMFGIFLYNISITFIITG